MSRKPADDDTMREEYDLPPQQNLWVAFGSGSLPRT